MPLAGDLLVVYSEAADIPSNGSTLPWEDAMRNTSAFRSGAPLGSPSRFRIGGGETAGAPSPPEHQLRVGDAIAVNVAWSYEQPLAPVADIKEYIAFYRNQVEILSEKS